ncbi:MAG: OmpA family protein [Neomegalonema sp.]|nr:OmpA family protein [Neomegalonema sp.]
MNSRIELYELAARAREAVRGNAYIMAVIAAILLALVIAIGGGGATRLSSARAEAASSAMAMTFTAPSAAVDAALDRAFRRQLAKSYREIASDAAGAARYALAKKFEQLAEDAQRIGVWVPQKPESIPDPIQRANVLDMRKTFGRYLELGMRKRSPVETAQAHAAFDCVVRASLSEGDATVRALCVERFRLALEQAKIFSHSVSHADSSAPKRRTFVFAKAIKPQVAPTSPAGARAGLLTRAEIETGAIAPSATPIAAVAASTSTKTEPDHAKRTAPRGLRRRRGKADFAVYFAPGSARLSIDSKTTLGRALRLAVGHARRGRRVKILLVGHSDKTGDAAANLRLSKARARAARRRLVARRIRTIASRKIRSRIVIRYRALGETAPAYRRGDGFDAAANRRVEVFVLPRR